MDEQDSRQRRRGPVSRSIDFFNAARTTYQGIKIARAGGAAAATAGSLGPIAIGVVVGIFLLVFLLVLTQGTGIAENLPPNTPSTTALPNLPQGNTPEEINQSIITTLRNNAGNIEVYKQASSATGIPWQVLAGIHYIEGGQGSNRSLVSGRVIGTREPDVRSCSSSYSGPGIPIPLPSGGCGFRSLLDSAIYAGKHLAGKVGKTSMSQEELVTALSRYNGGGNKNCSNTPPFQKTPYAGCPRLYEGEDDPYALALFDTRHSAMYLVYCADLTPCSTPQPFNRPGVMTVIRTVSANFN